MLRARGAALGAFAALGLGGAWSACGGAAFSAASPSDGGSTDAPPADVVAIDAPVGDTSIDAPPDAPGAWCAMQGQHLFCDDFTAPLPSNFQDVVQNAGGMVLEDSADALSLPHSLLAQTPSLSQVGYTAEAAVTKDFATDGLHDTLQFAVEISNSCFTTDPDPVTLAILVFPLQRYGLALTASISRASLVEATFGADGGITAAENHDLSASIPAEMWTTVSLDVKLGATRTATVLLAGAPALQSAPLLGAGATPPMHPTLLLGATTKNVAGASVGCNVHIDNVLFDIQP